MNTSSVVYGTKIESPATIKETEHETEDDSINNSEDNKIKNLLISSTSSSSSANSLNMLKSNYSFNSFISLVQRIAVQQELLVFITT